MAIGDIYNVQIHYNIGSELTVNVLHLRETVASTDPIPAQAVASAVIQEWDTLYNTELFSNLARATVLVIRRIKPTAGVPAINVLGATDIVGGNTSKPIPSASALLFSLYSATNTQSGRGRCYVPGVAIDNQNDGQLVAAAQTAAAIAANVFEDPWVATAPFTGEWECVIWSRKLQLAYAVENAIAHTNLATIKGRRNFPGLGA